MSEMMPNHEPGWDDKQRSVRIKAASQDFVLTPANTELLVFEFGDGEYDHLIHQCPDGEPLVIFFKMDKVEGLKEVLQNIGFDAEESDELDERTISIYSQIMASRIPDSPAALEEA